MKTTQKNFHYLRTNVIFAIFWTVLIFVLFVNAVHGQVIPENSGSEAQADPNFPGKKKFNAGVITTYAGVTPPPAIIGDVTYGITNRVSVGGMAGTTGALALAGIKVNASFLQRKNFQVVYRMITVYYPERNGKFLLDKKIKHVMPWMLSMAVLDAEWRSNTGIRWSLGMGLLETNCIEGLKKYFGGVSDEDKELPFEIFNTFQGSVSIPVSKRLIIRPEIITVMKGTDVIKSGKFKVFPINPFIKLIYTF